jgi:transposase-like protein
MRLLKHKGVTLQKKSTEMEKTEKIDKKMEDKRGRKSSVHTAEEKCRAVLSVWTEKRKAAEICRELGIAWTLLNQWQARAMEGMLLALQPRVQVEKGVALSPRLAVLLDKKIRQGSMKGLERRLARMQGGQAQTKAGETKETLAEKKI